MTYGIFNKIKNENKILLFILLFIFFTPIYFWDTQHSVFTVILFLIFIFRYKTSCFYVIKETFSNNKALVYIFIYFIYTYVSLFWTNDIDHGFAVQKIYREALLYIPLLYIFLEKKDIKTIFIVMSLSPALYSIYSLGIYFGFYSGFGSSINSPHGYLSYEKLSFVVSVSVVFSSILFLFEKRRDYKIFYFLIMLLSLVGLFINDGRAGKISFFLTMITIIVFYYKKIYSSKKITYFLLIVLVGFLIYAYNSGRVQQGINEIKTAINTSSYEGSWGIRLYMYITGGEIVKNNFLIGVGTGDSKSTFRLLAKKDNSPYQTFSHMHNQHIEFLARYGFIGYSILLFAIIYLLYSIRKNKLYFLLGFSFYVLVFYNALFNSILDRKPVHIMFFVIFACLSILNKKNIKN